jgi:Sugar phosphate isomerases/epimerases
MEIGLTTMSANKLFSDEELLKLYAENGIKYADYYFLRYGIKSPCRFERPEEATAYYSALGKYADSVGISFFQTHAAYPTWVPDRKENELIFNSTVSAIAGASALGAKYIVIHPEVRFRNRFFFMYPIRRAQNIKFYRRLIPYLEKYDMVCAVENMFSRNRRTKKLVRTTCSTSFEMLGYLKALNSDRFALCADVGHANIIYKDSGIRFLKKLGKNVKLVHLHDNSGREDEHLKPGDGKIDWDKVSKTLKEIGFDGVINLECHESITAGGKEKVAENIREIKKAAEICIRL